MVIIWRSCQMIENRGLGRELIAIQLQWQRSTRSRAVSWLCQLLKRGRAVSYYFKSRKHSGQAFEDHTNVSALRGVEPSTLSAQYTQPLYYSYIQPTTSEDVNEIKSMYFLLHRLTIFDILPLYLDCSRSVVYSDGAFPLPIKGS